LRGCAWWLYQTLVRAVLHPHTRIHIRQIWRRPRRTWRSPKRWVCWLAEGVCI